MMKLLAVMAALLGLSGCENLYQTVNPRPPVDVAALTYARPEVVVVPPVNNGSIFQANQYRPLFEDHRARLVGDSLTVQIVEKVSASQKSTSSIDKSGKLSGGVTALPFVSQKRHEHRTRTDQARELQARTGADRGLAGGRHRAGGDP